MANLMQRETADEMKRQNPENFNVIVSGRAMREPRRLIYIHSVSKRSFNVSRDAVFQESESGRMREWGALCDLCGHCRPGSSRLLRIRSAVE